MLRWGCWLWLPWLAHAEPSAESLLRAGRVDEALPLIQQAARSTPDDLDAQERYIDVMHSVGMGHLAEQNMRVRAASAPSEAVSWYLLGRAVRTAEEAREAYETCLELDPTYHRAWMGLGAVHRGLQDHAAAEQAYRKALAGDPTLAEAWAGLNAALLAQGQLDKAVASARQAVQAVPGDPDVWLALALLEPDKARETLVAARVNVKDDPRIHAALAEEELLRGNGAAARNAAEAALAIDPNHSGAALSRLFARELELGRLDVSAYKSLLIAQELEAREPAESIRRYNELIGTHPDSPLVWMSRARLLQASDPVAAVEDLKSAIQRDPENIEAIAALGLLLLRLGHPTDARPFLERASDDRPHDASLAVAAARAARRSGDLAGAGLRLDAALQQSPRHVELLLVTAQTRSELGDAQGAYDLLRERAPEVPDVRVGLALAAAARDIGRTEEAARILQELGEATSNPAMVEVAGRLRSEAPQAPPKP